MKRLRIMAFCFALVSCVGQPQAYSPTPNHARQALPVQVETLDVMTYNVKGLPFPLARGRTENLQAIAATLSQMREDGSQPAIIVLQEAFTTEAQALGEAAGYRYFAIGPKAKDAPEPSSPPISAAFAKAADWTKGEESSPLLGSGLMVLSDYPLARTRIEAFPQGACAGFDCLAAKGVMIAWVELPGHEQPLAIATTHLNSKKSSGVPMPRANTAFDWQWRAARDFVGTFIEPDAPIIFAGDFNIGGNTDRLAAARRMGPPLPKGENAVAQMARQEAYPAEHHAEVARLRAELTDIQFYRSGTQLQLEPQFLDIPFHEDGNPRPLSDHPGFTISYRISSAD